MDTHQLRDAEAETDDALVVLDALGARIEDGGNPPLGLLVICAAKAITSAVRESGLRG